MVASGDVYILSIADTSIKRLIYDPLNPDPTVQLFAPIISLVVGYLGIAQSDHSLCPRRISEFEKVIQIHLRTDQVRNPP